MKALLDLATLPELISSDAQGLLTQDDFLDSTIDGIHSCIIVMDQAIQQRDRVFKRILNYIRDEDIDNQSVDFLLKRNIENLTTNECLTTEQKYLRSTDYITKSVVAVSTTIKLTLR